MRTRRGFGAKDDYGWLSALPYLFDGCSRCQTYRTSCVLRMRTRTFERTVQSTHTHKHITLNRTLGTLVRPPFRQYLPCPCWLARSHANHTASHSCVKYVQYARKLASIISPVAAAVAVDVQRRRRPRHRCLAIDIIRYVHVRR